MLIGETFLLNQSEVKILKLKNKVIAITGAGGGIGRAAASLFVEEGARVAILEINEDTGRQTENEIIEKGGEAFFIYTDISQETSVEAAFRSVGERFGRLDALYNNASVFLGSEDARITRLSTNAWRKVLSINLDGLFFSSKYAIPMIIRSGGGAVLNTASSAAVTGVPECAAYTASKGATVALTRAMAVEYGPLGVRVNCVAPAAILTDMARESNLSNPNFSETRFLNETTPLKRWGSPEDIAKIACFLLSDDASYINGAILTADGGITINGTVNSNGNEDSA